MSEILLQMKEITKSFPGVLANDKISFDLFKGEVHALVGENGAGKSTLMKILYGLYKADSGDLIVKNKVISIKKPKDAIKFSIGMVHQHFMLVPVFTVLENIIIGHETHTAGIITNKEPIERINKIINDNKLYVDLNSRVENLPVGLQQRVEIIKILYRGAEILIFDEPTAVLNPQEILELFKTLNELKASGKGIIFISHKLDEVIDIADRITVLRNGKVIQTLLKENATKSMIAELMVGKPVFLNVKIPPLEPGKKVLEIKNLTKTGDKGIKVLDNINITIREGEIFGIAGVEGNGQSALINSIIGEDKNISGNILLYGESIKNDSIRLKREKGIAYIPEDRHKYGLFLPFSIEENSVIGRHHKYPFVNLFQIINRKKIQEFAKKIIARFDIRTSSEKKIVHSLSGGNQQKIIVAREISFDPKLLIASQPTRGIDIGASEFIYTQLVSFRNEKKAILLVSADLDEVISLSDRIAVIYNGRLIQEFSRENALKEKIGFYMMGDKK